MQDFVFQVTETMYGWVESTKWGHKLTQEDIQTGYHGQSNYDFNLSLNIFPKFCTMYT